MNPGHAHLYMIAGSESHRRPHAKGMSYFGGGKMNNACGLSFGRQKSILNLYYLNFANQFHNQILKTRKKCNSGRPFGWWGQRLQKRASRGASKTAIFYQKLKK
jgi:hypothetical protein